MADFDAFVRRVLAPVPPAYGVLRGRRLRPGAFRAVAGDLARPGSDEIGPEVLARLAGALRHSDEEMTRRACGPGGLGGTSGGGQGGGGQGGRDAD